MQKQLRQRKSVFFNNEDAFLRTRRLLALGTALAFARLLRELRARGASASGRDSPPKDGYASGAEPR